MTLHRLPRILTLLAVLGATGLAAGANATAAEEPSASASSAQDKENQPKKELFTGKVVMLTEALEKRGINAYEEMEEQVVLETPDGRLIPIIADWRGRAFFQDERLRNRKVELVGIQQDGVPYLQVLMIFTFDEKGRRMYTDYWCDVCNIPMYEIKPCDCCQGSIRLRFQPQDLPAYLTEKSDTGGAE